MYTYDSTAEELEAAVKRLVGHVRMPNINYDSEMPLEWLYLRGDLADWEKAPYEKLITELVKPYFLYHKGLEPIDEYDSTFGFNPREVNHPVLNALMLDLTRYHYKFMYPIIKRVRKEVEKEEHKRGQKYDDDDFWWMVRNRAIEARQVELGQTADTSYAARINKIYAPPTRAEERAAEAEYRASQSTMESVVGFAQRHPFFSGLMAYFAYSKVKSLFER